MLFFTRWKAAAILLTAFFVCLCAVPNFFPESTVKRWPEWAQRHIVLGLDLQGGSHLLLQVDSNAVRKERLQSLNDDVLRVLRQARIQFTGRAIVGNGVQVHITRDTDVDIGVREVSDRSADRGVVHKAGHGTELVRGAKKLLDGFRTSRVNLNGNRPSPRSRRDSHYGIGCR